MSKHLTLSLIAVLCFVTAQSQNVFSANDAIVRYDASKPLGSAERPDPAKPGLQKWVSTPTSGVSVGSSSIDVSSFKQYFINFNGTPMAFRIKYPRSYSNGDSAVKKYPIMLFLHGAGEVGCPTNNGVYNNEKQLWLGGGLFRDFVDQNLFDGFLVYPQLVNAEGCWGSWGSVPSANFLAILGMIDSMAKYVRADLDRVVVNGLSGGGYGAWRIADIAPQRIAKIIPSAAASTSVNRTNIVHIPIWFATGAKDPDPNTTQANNAYNRMKEIGADIRYTQYADLGHAVWYRHWREPDYSAAMNDIHKANPLVYFQHNAFCADSTINAKLGISPGFYAYEWQRDGATIATRTGAANNILAPNHITSFTGNEIVVKSYGSYRVRFKRTSSSSWSVFSPKPVEVKLKTITETPDITVMDKRSSVLPALDGSTSAPLQLPEGYIKYEWFRVGDNSLVSATRIYEAPVGVFKAKVSEQFGCGSEFSPNFTVTNANGSPKPDNPSQLIATPFSQTSVSLRWTQGVNETGFEVYRSTRPGGPYEFAAITAANASLYTDTALAPNTSYYYIIRAVNTTGASQKSNEATATTLSDRSIPTAPSGVRYRGSTSSSVQLSWNAGADNGGIKRYDIYANGTKMFSSTDTRFNVTDLDSATAYVFTVKSVDNSENLSVPAGQVSGFTHKQGLNYKYYTTTSNWYTIPNLKTLTPKKTGITDSVNVNDASIKSETLRFAFLWEGYIYIPETSTYTFETRSDDGSKLYIDVPYSHTAKALVNNDTIHGMRSRTGTITLAQGYHSIAITFFQRVNGLGLELYWKNSSGLARELIPKNFFSLTTGPGTNAPAIPEGVAATAISDQQVKLDWTDNNSDETAYEVVRSTSSGGTYVPVGTVPANTTQFYDSGLVAQKAYYYKLRAVKEGGESGFTTPISATTLARPKTVPAPSPLIALAGAGSSVILNWQDKAINEWNYRVYRSINGSKFYVLFASKANVNAYTDQTAASQTVYYYYVQGYNGSGLGEKSNVVKIKAGNQAPALDPQEHIFVKTGQTLHKELNVADEPGDTADVIVVNKPSFVTVTHTAGNSFTLTLNPGNDHVGQHTVTLQVTDQHGSSSTTPVLITVTDQKTRSVFLNFGENAKTAGPPWNNWTGKRAAGDIVSNLADENNQPTSISVTTVNGWSTTTVLGHLTGNNSGVAPDAVLESGLADNGTARQILISGLRTGNKYNLQFIGSQNEGLVATVQYSSGTENATLDARYNTHWAASLNGLIPDASGQLLVNITRTGGSAFSYLNGLIIEEIQDNAALLNPQHLYAEVVNANSVLLNWTERSDNESAIWGIVIQRSTDSMFTQNATQITLNANTNIYIDADVTPDTRYWYRVRTINGTQSSEYSNRFRVVVPASTVYINFNSTLPDAAVPWNNTAASPLSEFIIDNLYDDAGSVSGLSMAVTKVFNGEFTAGANTGNNSGVVPDNVLASNFWIDNTQLSQVKLSGFNHTKRYRIGFTGSSSSPGWFKGNYTATYSVNDRTVYLNSWMNTSKIVYIGDVAPDAGGNIFLDFSTTPIAQWAFNAGIIVQEYNDPKGGYPVYSSDSKIDTTEVQGVATLRAIKARVYPNPFADQLNIDYYNPSATGKVTIELHDVAGRLVHRANYSEMPAGNNTLRIIPRSNIGDGMLMLTVKVDGKTVHSTTLLKRRFE